ncbi:MAG: hypothetical protein LAO51_16190 [Acidobacteriia bacterium]|nr:hypothetical protein [Terriglobia bacterium]
MAQRSRAKFEKRQKELARQDRQKAKRARRLESREQKGDEAPAALDPDAAAAPADPLPPQDES